MYCVGGSLKKLCHFEMEGDLANADVIRGGGGWSLNADSGEGGGGKICQNLADVICERSLITLHYVFTPLLKKQFESVTII